MSKIKPHWELSVVVADKVNLPRQNVQSVIRLLDEGATIPFIARYRKDQTGNLEPGVLREIESNVEDMRAVENKMQTVHIAIAKLGKMSTEVERSLKMSTSILEIDTLYAPYKPGHKGSYAERARALGLDVYATQLMNGMPVNLSEAVNCNEKGLSSLAEVEKGVKHIIADIVAKDQEMAELARKLSERHPVSLESSRLKKPSSSKQDEIKKPSKTKAPFNKEKISEHKFEQYFDFKMQASRLKPHQVLALNRGEDQKILSVKVVVPHMVKESFLRTCWNKFLHSTHNAFCRSLIQAACLDGYDRLVEPALIRHIRSELAKTAEKASISVFSSNLKGLLLIPPIRQKCILGIDPGFSNGCKFAVISSTGDILHTEVAYLHRNVSSQVERNKLASAVGNFQCETVAIGNGVACRETEKIISDMIKFNAFQHAVVYCIVDECGASIYSASEQAKKEMPDLDLTLRGAVSIARRLQDPLAEFVKIEPQHLGVGMYQHDINKTKLQKALDSVVEECVSFVGVDLNTCSECLLRRVAGLNSGTAKKLLEWRSKHGHFTSRKQLLGIKGLGKKSFEQCAGFVRIMRQELSRSCPEPETSEETSLPTKGSRKRKCSTANPRKAKALKTEDDAWNPLDATAVHPESYDLTGRFASHFHLDLSLFGSTEFRQKVKAFATPQALSQFCEEQDAGKATIQLIADALQQPLSHDIRDEFQKPLFKKEVTSVSDLKCGSLITGRITNVTHFGAFTDIGVGINGLIHVSKMGRVGSVHVGDTVEVKVVNMDLGRNRIGLSLNKVL